MKKNLVIAWLSMTAAILPLKLCAGTAYSTIVSNEAPLVYWNFDEGSGPTKQIMPLTVPLLSNNLSPTNNATRVAHASLGDGLQLGNAVSLSGSGDCFSGTLSTTLPLLQPPYAIEFWIQVLSNTNSQLYDYVMGFGSGNYPAVLYDYNTPRLSFEMYSQDAGRSAVGPQIADNAWHHLVIAYYGDGTTGVGQGLYMYLDGTNAFSDIRANFHRGLDLTKLTFGTVNPTAAQSFAGNLDELAIYNLHNLTNASDITAKVSAISSNHFALGKTAASPDAYSQAVAQDDPYLYWNFNETDGDALEIAPETIPPANALYPLNNASYVSHASLHDGLDLGNAASLTNQTSGFAQVFGTSGTYGLPATLPGAYAIEFWAQIQGDTNNMRFDYLLAFNGNFPAVLYDYNTPRYSWEMYSTGGTGRSGIGATYVDYSWHHLVFVYYGDGINGVADQLSMYVDGTNAVQNMRGNFNRALQPASVVVGCYNTVGALVDTFVGNIDELAIYDLSDFPDADSVTAKAEAIASHYWAAQIPVGPTLSITTGAGGLTVSWPSPSTGYSLQEASSLGGLWTPQGSAPNLVGGNLQVTIPIGATNQFFRLQK